MFLLSFMHTLKFRTYTSVIFIICHIKGVQKGVLKE